ncbi:MAG TPA: nucleotidyltransferase domain-containing protein [Acidiferrobacterales bacterium]|nr:nucleotidyltransferase domain-containing protein [Acidiferrobacterales bacterium]
MDSILGSVGNVRLLRLLAEHGGPLSVAQLARDSGMSGVGVRAALAGLARQGLVSTFGQARAQLHALNPSHPFAESLKAFFAQEQAHWQALMRDLRGALARFESVKAAWLYGSAARGEDKPGSDLDIALVVEGDLATTTSAVQEAMQALEDRYHVPISVVALSPQQILARADHDPWWTDVVRDGQSLKTAAPQRYVAQLRRSAAPV